MQNKTNLQGGNNDFISPATKLLEKRRQMYQIHEEFELQKQEQAKLEEKFAVMENDLKNDDFELQEELMKFCKFLQDNEAKKLRAEKRFLEEQRAKDYKEKEIKELKNQYDEIQNQKVKLEKKASSLKKYEEYLDLVIKAHSDDYADLSEILNRYRTLTQSNNRQQRDHREIVEKNDTLKKKSTQYIKDKSGEFLQLSNDVKEYQKKIEYKKIELSNLQQISEASGQVSSEQTLNLGRLIMAIDNLYTRCNRDQRQLQKLKQHNEDNDNQQNDNHEDKKHKYQIQQQMDNDFDHKRDDAIIKLEQLKHYMTDFKTIINHFSKDKKDKYKKTSQY